MLRETDNEDSLNFQIYEDEIHPSHWKIHVLGDNEHNKH